MARRGAFDATATPIGWFDETASPAGWFDESLAEQTPLNARVTWAEIEVPAAGTPAGAIKAWNGSAWVTGTLKRWDGSAWVAAALKRWNGSAWVTV